jgi:hypothetical protein
VNWLQSKEDGQRKNEEYGKGMGGSKKFCHQELSIAGYNPSMAIKI